MPTDAREPASYQTIAAIDEGARRAAVLEAALELDVFSAIGPRTMDLQQVALAAAADPRALAVLLDALCALGLLGKSSAGYRLEAAAAAFLARGGESFGGDVVLQMSAARRRLADVVRSGSAVADLVALSGGDFWAEFTAQRLVTWPEGVEEELAMWREFGVTAGRCPGARILDVACGSGVRSFGLAREDPEVRIVALDSAPVLEIAKQVAARMGVGERIVFRAGDVTSSDLGGEELVVLLSNLLYFFTPEGRRAGFVEVVRRGEEIVTAVRPA